MCFFVGYCLQALPLQGLIGVHTPFSLGFLQIKNLGLSLLVLILLVFALLTSNESRLHTQSINNMENVYHPLIQNIRKITTNLETLNITNNVPTLLTSDTNIQTLQNTMELISGFKDNPQLIELDKLVNKLGADGVASLINGRASNGAGHSAHTTGTDHSSPASMPAPTKDPQHGSHSALPEPASDSTMTHDAPLMMQATADSMHESINHIAQNALSQAEELNDAFHALKLINVTQARYAQPYLKLANELIPKLKQQTDRLENRLNYLLDADNHILLTRLDRFKRTRYVITLLGCVLALCVSLLMSRYIDKQVNIVSEGTRLLSEGQLSYRIPITSQDQLGKISHAFNKMADKLQAREFESNALIDEIDRSAQEAASANAAKGDFLASMSHEIRTPINGILGTADLLIREPLTRSQAHLTDTIQRSGNTLLQIINDILDFSKIEAGGMELEHEPFNLMELVEDVGEMAAPAAHAKGLDLNYLFDFEANVYFKGDALRIRQIVTNLVSNAIKFTDNGDVSITVQSKVANGSSSTVTISVQDTGIGMSEEAQARIFQPFSQASRSTTRKYGGTGLGLSISKQLTDMMEGDLSIVSTLGQGSAFHLAIELDEFESNDEESSTASNFDNVSVLLVSDHHKTIEAMQSQFSMLGVESVLVCSGQKAFDSIDEHAQANKNKISENIQLVIVDNKLTDMSGLDFFRQLKEKQKNLHQYRKIKLCMVNEPDDVKKRYDDVDIEFTLNKPVRQSALYNCLTGARYEDGSAAKFHHNAIKDEQFNADILLAEDHPINQDIITRMLKILGCQVTIAENGQIALDKLNQQRYDIVFMDCDMPVLDGFSATKKQREREQQEESSFHQPIIALTANALDGDRQRCLDIGMDDYLTKPLSIDDLKKTLAQWTKKKNKQVDEGDELNHINSIANERAKEKAKERANERAKERAHEKQIQLLDRPTVDQLIAMDENQSMNFFNELLENFIANWHEDIKRLNDAIDNSLPENTRKMAHRLKSASATMGASRASNLASKIEIAATQHDMTGCAQRLEALNAAFDATVHEYALLSSKAA